MLEQRETILEEAQRITSGDRRKEYGSARKQLFVMSGLWSVIIGAPVSPAQAGLCLLMLKVSREMHAHKRDNLVDMAGYARVLEMLYDGD